MVCSSSLTTVTSQSPSAKSEFFVDIIHFERPLIASFFKGMGHA